MGNRTYHKRGELVHGHTVSKHPLYRTWGAMLARCNNPNEKAYPNYGGRGISVCGRWYHFANFARDMWPKPTKQHTIERVDNSKGYYPDNCIWASRSDQCVNRRKFRNNTSGATGVKRLSNGTYSAVFDYDKERFDIGRFEYLDDAISARISFIDLFKRNPVAAINKLAGEKPALNSTTKIKGVSVSGDGFIARATIGGTRHYIGYFKTIGEAEHGRLKFIEERTGKTEG